MADLRVSYAELKALGNNVQTKGEEFTSLLNSVEQNNGRLKNAWQGTDASKFSNAIEEQAAAMKKLGDAINEIGAFLIKAGELYESARDTNLDGIRQ